MFDRRFAALAQREALASRRSEEAFRELYRRTPLPLIAVDGSNAIVEASDAWLDLLGYQRGEVLGRGLQEFAAGEENGTLFLPSVRQVTLQGEIRDVEARVRTRTGAALDVLVSARAEENPDGTFRGALFGLVDVTARHHAEAALRQSQKMEALGQMTGGVAHDFNNVLAVVLGNLDRLRKRLAHDRESRRLAEQAVEGAKRGIGITKRMLAFARQETLQPEPIVLPELLPSMDDLIGQSVGPEFAVSMQIEPDLPAVQVDGNQLVVALLNLVVNGRDAMPSGGMLTISAFAADICDGDELELRPGKYVCLAVSDHGEGMDAETLARARDPFFTTKPVGKGTGLGLSMVHGFAAQSGGALRLRSRPGEGSIAEIWLPALTGPAAMPIPLEYDRMFSVEPCRLRILAVDDDVLVLMNTVAMLQELGHDVLEASSGPQALSILEKQNKVDLVVADQGMPGMTGVQLGERIHSSGSKVPILIVTGYTTFPDAESYVRLLKPFSLSDLRAAITQCVTNVANAAPAGSKEEPSAAATPQNEAVAGCLPGGVARR
jgi:PAS domain S-box-containing protein